MIAVGDGWAEEQRHQLELADVVLLLVSADFLASNHPVDREMRQPWRGTRHETGGCRVVPVIVRPCD